MSRNLHEKVGAMEYEKLFAGIEPPALVRGGVIDKLATAKTLKRGTVMAKGATSGKLFVLGETKTYETHQDFEGDASTTEFTVTAKPATLNKVTVGGTVKVITTDYTYVAATGVITFTTAPADDAAIIAYYDVADTGTADCILTDDVEVGTDADVNTTVYISGNFNIDGVIVAENYTITESDKDNLRMKGILFGTVQEP